MFDNCTICLSPLEDNHIQKKLTCGHRFHYRCYLKMVYSGKNYFIQCPLCRTINIDNRRPTDDPERNLRLLCSQKVGKVRCLGRTKNNRVCKRKACLLNYGYCYQHHSPVLKKEMYPLMERYMNFILCQRNNWLSKIYLFDIGKKLIIEHFNESLKIEDILVFFYKYLTVRNINYISSYIDIYDYYNLDVPINNWVKYCFSKYILI